MWCLFVFCSTPAAFLQEVAASYVLGAVGGLVYLRLLHKSLDSLGGGGSAVGGIVSNQRLLVPIILVMAFNRFARPYVICPDHYRSHAAAVLRSVFASRMSAYRYFDSIAFCGMGWLISPYSVAAWSILLYLQA